MKNAIKGLFASKKFLLILVAIATLVVGKVGLDVDEKLIEQIVLLIGVLVAGQAAADFGKERTKISIEATRGKADPPL